MKLTIIGGGPGGYTAAFAAAKAGVEVTLVERAHLGGTCLHTGCIPTKTLRSSADALDTVARLREFGIAGDCAATPDMSAIVARKRKVTATLQTGLEKTAAQLKVRVVRGDAEFVGAGLVRVASVDGSLEIAGDRVILATGSSPLELPSLPVDHRLVLSSDDALELQTVPEHLGVIGCELAFIYRAFGAKVTVIEGQGRLLPLPSVDGEISRLLLREMKKKGIAVELSHTVSRVTPCDGGAAVEIAPFPTGAGDSRVLNASAVCVTVGRVPNTAGLAEAGIALDQRGWIVVDDTLETSVPGVYAIGDVTGPRRIMLAHMAAAEAHTAVHNILHPEKKKVQSYTVVPSAIFTSPEIGDVGLTEEQAREQGIAVRSAVFQFRELGKAQAMGALSGLFKIVAEEGTGKLLGVHIAGAHASDLIAEATFALQKGCSARDLFETIHAHPTLSEGLYEAAGMLA
ncbi:dihydrolipoyl dehydrogenase [Bilophila wadsworthia]|uniref:dihydrolipoyl dehydrogenase n=1 Tax=Bilophila wadsworthia TaxID=35833 RepID=UPI00267207E1|nr:dihydrolipoyl dehydrogenase [Bilophila wadsworthia]